ncbi:uncharacterized protein [Montipora capricornis]|uniref:uncharacterized protein n=1 Tax=Montipora capricornis TaxID=246305 RepID=UPI0035F1765D
MVKMEKVSDVLGSEGRKALNACVKVKIYGRRENIQKYHWEQAFSRLRRCYEGAVSKPLFSDLYSKYFMLPPDENGSPNKEAIFDIFEIHNALVRCDELPYVEKYPRPGPRYDKMKELIDKRRAAIERRCQETTENPEQYSWLAARRLVRDCFAGGFPRDQGFFLHALLDFLPHDQRWTIRQIYYSFSFWDYALYLSDISADAAAKDTSVAHRSSNVHFWGYTISQNRESIAKDAEREKNRIERTDGSTETTLYPKYDAAAKVKDCYSNACFLTKNDIFPLKPCEDSCTKSYSIIDIDQAVKDLDGKKAIQKYPEDDCPGSDELKRLIDKCRTEVDEEYKKADEFAGGYVDYSQIEAEHRVRDCFAGPGPVEHVVETDVLLSKKGREEEVRVSKANQTYNIFEIKSAVDCLDSKKLGDLFQEGKYESNMEARAEITEEYNEASQKVEIEHGSGIIVHEHFVVTNKHVIEDVMNDTSKEVSIFNAAIGECSCEVVHYDAHKDLALLCSKDGLKLEEKKISPLQLSSQSLLPGMQIFAFGFPMSHTGETALFVTGHVSGSKKNYSGQTFAVLNCSLNGGNSGGPILCWVKGQLKVVGVAMQKHFKEILTLEERLKIEKIRESFQTSTICGVSDEEILSATFSSSDPCEIPLKQFKLFSGEKRRRAMSSSSDPCQNPLEQFGFSGEKRKRATSSSSDPRQIPLNLLTLKLYNALETHSQFNLSNAVPGRDVIDFIKDALLKYNGQHKEELSQILQWSD